MGISPAITVFNNDNNRDERKSHIRDTHLSVEEFSPTLEEGFRYRPFFRDDEEDQDEDEDSEARHRRRLAKRQNAGWRPGVKEWLVLVCVSIVVMMDAFDATVVIPLVPVCNYILSCFIFPLNLSLLDMGS